MSEYDRLALVCDVIHKALTEAVERGDIPDAARYDRDKDDGTGWLVGMNDRGAWTITVEVDFL